jgi:hypothetical protein
MDIFRDGKKGTTVLVIATSCVSIFFLFSATTLAQTVPVPTGNTAGQSWQLTSGNVMGWILSALAPGAIGVAGLFSIFCIPFRGLITYLPKVLLVAACIGGFGWGFPKLLQLFGVA